MIEAREMRASRSGRSTTVRDDAARAWSSISSGTSTAGWSPCSRARSACGTRGRGGRRADRAHDRARRWTADGLSRRSRRLALPRGAQPPDRRPAAEAGRLRILERAAGDERRRRRSAGGRRISPARCATTCCACCSSAATTRSRASRAGARAEDAVRLQHRGDRAAALHEPKRTCTSACARARAAARVAARRRRHRRSRRCGRACRACTRCSTCSSTRATSPRTRSRRSAASCATRRSGWPRCSPSTRWARSRRPSRCSRSCTSTPPGLPRAVDGMGGLLLLEEQDRSLWDRERMRARRASGWRAPPAARCSRASTPRPASPPSIASRRRSAQTRWKEIADLYAMLENASPRRRCTR